MKPSESASFNFSKSSWIGAGEYSPSSNDARRASVYSGSRSAFGFSFSAVKPHESAREIE